jgi:hypothetical protein
MGGAGGAGGAGGGMGGGGAGGAGGNPGGAGSGGAGECATCLLHRYSFNGSGTTITDSIGTAHGVAVGATVSNGEIVLAGGTSDQYVALPAGILSSLTNTTLEVWFTWTPSTVSWQRVFDFGSSSAGAGQGSGVTYLYLTPRVTSGAMRVGFSIAGSANESFFLGPALVPGTTHAAVVVDDTQNVLSLYVNGTLQGNMPFSNQLSELYDVNCWLGRSQFTADSDFAGTLHEFRIYADARSAGQVLASFQAGANALPPE